MLGTKNIKSYKTPESIAKKHNVSLATINSQLKLGIKIEHEHTNSEKLAKIIALQHLDEVPDYYTKLKNVENKKSNSEEAVKELELKLKKLSDISYDSIDKLMRKIMKRRSMTSKELHNAFVKKHKKTPDDWIKELNEGTLHAWFKDSKSKDGKAGWVQADGSPCANEEGETKTPKCFSSSRLKSLKRKGKKGLNIIKSAVRRKREQDPNQQKKTGGASPTMVPTFAKGKKDKNYIKPEPTIKESMYLEETKKDKPSKGSGEKDACYYKVKARYKVWPSAYASGALVKCRKSGAKNWGTQSEETYTSSLDYVYDGPPFSNNKRYCPKCKKDETRNECKYGVKYWDMFSLPAQLGQTSNQLKYNVATVHPGNFNEEKDHEYSMARAEISKVISAANRLRKKVKRGEGNIEAWVQSKITKAADYIDTAADYMDSSEGKLKEGVSSRLLRKTIVDGPRGSIGDDPKNSPGNTNSSTPLKEQILFEKCWKGYKKRGMKRKGNRLVPNCVKEGKTFAQFMAEAKVNKDEMPCNKPKAQAVGDSLTGKSHVVKACENGKEKIIRFGQRGVKGSPKKKGESEAYKNRRLRFKARHAKNIAKGKMSAAYWSNKVKW